MLEYKLDIHNDSTWIITTQNPTTKSMPFYLTEIGRFFAGREYYTKRADKEGYYLLYTVSGCGRMETGHGVYELPARNAILVRCEAPHLYGTISEQVWDNCWIHLGGAGADAYHGLLREAPVVVSRPARVEELFARLLEGARQEDVVATARGCRDLGALLTEMVESALGTGKGTDTVNHTGVQTALNYIRANFQKSISIEDIIRDVNISKFHFVRLFHKYMGTTPYNYLIHYRINQSKRLLCTTDLSVAEIAAQVGYSSESNYIHQFGKLTGISPAQFRKNNLSYSPDVADG